MHAATNHFLVSLAMVLGVAAVTTVIFQRLRQPVVLGYILAGLIIGPHVPIPLVADAEIVHTLSELGVILLMFSLGLEFSIRKLIRVAPTAGLTAVIQCSVMMWLGFMTGRLLGWTDEESIFCGAIIAISSTTIIAKAFDEQRIGGTLREVVVGILIVEDLIAVLLMAGLTTVAAGSGLSAGALAATTGKLVGFLLALVVVGLLVVPRVMRWVVKLGRPETTLVAVIGLCFGIALLAHELGYSVALGAFIAGSLVAESGHHEEIEHLVRPVRDVFAAVFFVSVGMLIDPALVAEHWLAVLLLTVVVIVGKLGSVSLGAFLTGNGTRTSIRAGMSLAQIGEFSFIIAGLGLTLGATRSFLYPVAVAVSAITTLTTPWFIRGSEGVASFVDRRLPRPLQTFATLYGSWWERARAAGKAAHGPRSARRVVGLLLADVTVLVALALGVALGMDRLAVLVHEHVIAAPPVWIRVGIGALATIVAGPFLFGVFRLSRRLGDILAARAMPEVGAGTADLARAPRRAFVITLQLACMLLVGLPLAAVLQPFFPHFPTLVLLLPVLAIVGLAFWRSATNLHGHVRAGSQMILEALKAQSAQPTDLEHVHHLVPGLGEPVPCRLDAGCDAVGRTLAQVNLRGLTGATVIAITRADGGVSTPTAAEVLRAGDVLALAGTQEAVAAARELLGVRSRGPGGASAPG
jgi:CPA2 family monovalent cation:H+ antiporter-2